MPDPRLTRAVMWAGGMLLGPMLGLLAVVVVRCQVIEIMEWAHRRRK